MDWKREGKVGERRIVNAGNQSNISNSQFGTSKHVLGVYSQQPVLALITQSQVNIV
jgi:hypothetical protein